MQEPLLSQHGGRDGRSGGENGSGLCNHGSQSLDAPTQIKSVPASSGAYWV
jgi:hypothetical protein